MKVNIALLTVTDTRTIDNDKSLEFWSIRLKSQITI